MKKEKRVICWTAMLFLLLSVFPAVSFAAWEHGDKGNADFTKILIGKDKKEYYINENVKTVVYDNKGGKKIKDGNGRTKVRWRYLKISDKTDGTSKYGYCAEFGAGFSDKASYKASDSAKDKTLFQNLPQDAQKIIAATLCYGRNGSRKVPVSGANDADYYFATQVIVWEAQQGLRTIYKKDGKSKGTRLAKAHSMSAKHMQQFLKGRPAEKCYDWLLKKINDHLTIHSFAAEKKTSAPVYTMKYNKNTKKWSLVLTDTNKKVNGIQSANSKVKVSRSGSKYTLESSVEIEDPVLVAASNKMTEGSASGKILAWNCTTNSANQAMLMGSKDMISMYFKVQTESPGKVILQKKDEETGKLIKASPTIYEVKDMDTGTVVSGSLKTGSGGNVSLSVQPGNYQLREIQAPEGYVIKKEPQKFSVKAGSTVTMDQKDVPQKGRLKISKTGELPQVTPAELDEEGKDQEKKEVETRPLEGAVFEVKAAKDIVTGDGTIRLKAGETADTIKTDQEGKASTKELYLGAYNVIEKEAPEGYLCSQESIPVELRFSGQESTITTTELNITNQYKRGGAEIEKTDVSTGEPLPETGIEILDENKKVLLQSRTDENGKALFQDLPVGKYFFREFDAPEGYLIDETPFPFEIKEDGQIVKCEMSNERVPEKETAAKETEQTTVPTTAPDIQQSTETIPTTQLETRVLLDSSPQTGDQSHLLWICGILLCASAGIIFLLIRIHKRY